MKKGLQLLVVLVLVLSVLAVMPVTAQDKTKIVVGTNAEYPPFESVDDNDAIVGFDIDLFNAIAADAGLEVEFVNTKWDGIFAALAAGEFDVVISAATITEDREKEIDFTNPYFNAGQSIAVRAALADQISVPEDLIGLRVGVQLGTTGDEFATALLGEDNVNRYDEVTLAFQAMGAGELDAIINDGPTSADIIANNPDIEAVIVGEPLTDEFYGIAVNPELTDLLDALNVSLANVIEDGTYAEIYETWFGQAPSAMFLPAAAVAEIDYTDPESVAVGIVEAFFNTAETPEDLLVFACDGAGESPFLPDQATLDGFAGITADLSNFTVTASIDGNKASVTFDEDATITLLIGETEQTLPASLLAAQVGVQAIELVQNDEGRWELCPEDA